MKLIRTSISLPADEHARLTRLAKSNRRSMSSEILFQLGQVRPSKPAQPT